MSLAIQEASPSQATELSEIAVKAKSHWGYSDDQMALWRDEFLTITSDYIEAHQVWCTVIDEKVVGFAAIEQHEEAILEHLWVSPDYIGQGIGKRLFLYVAEHIPEFVFTSDPHADAFYIKMGAIKIGEYQSMLQGRMLTEFKYTSV